MVRSAVQLNRAAVDPPEQLLRALILQALYTIRSERQRMDQIDGNWRYRWFVGLKLDEAEWDVAVFTKNRERLRAGERCSGTRMNRRAIRRRESITRAAGRQGVRATWGT
jgi:transposase